MTQLSPEFVERFQLEYQKNPKSRIFAPLAEAYRRMGLLNEALRICESGVSFHPGFAGGRVAYAKVLTDLKKYSESLLQLEAAIKLSPDNLLAHSLMGDVLLQLRRPKDALKSFKNVLFLNPNDSRAHSIVQKWEFLSADEYDRELFEIDPNLPAKSAEPAPTNTNKANEGVEAYRSQRVERAISLADAFTVRGDHERALDILLKGRETLGIVEEIEKRIRLLSRRSSRTIEPPSDAHADLGLSESPNSAKKQKLELFLQRINERRIGS